MLHFVKGKMNPLTGRNVKLNRLHKLFAKLKEGVPALVKPFLGNSMDDWCNSQFVLSLLILWSHLGLQSTVKPPTCPLVDRLTELPWPSVFTLTLHEGCIHKQHLCVCFIDKHQPPRDMLYWTYLACLVLSLSSLPHSQSLPGSTAKWSASSLCSESVRGITAGRDEIIRRLVWSSFNIGRYIAHHLFPHKAIMV